MTDRRWILLTSAAIATAVACTLVLCYWTDCYGLLRDPKGRKLSIYCADRKAKFLLSKRYVPANFDGLILGPSSSSNWDLSNLSGARVYNESVLGANASEERRIAEQALRNGRLRIAICVLTPKMTSSHAMNDGLDTVTSREALGSIHVFINDAANSLLAMHIRIGKQQAPPNGARPIQDTKRGATAVFPSSYYAIDPVALADYRNVVLSLRQHGARIIYVVPPMYEPCFQINRAGLTAYLSLIARDMPSAPILDFSSPAYSALGRDRDSFTDCLHLNANGALKMDALLDQLLPGQLGTAEAIRQPVSAHSLD